MRGDDLDSYIATFKHLAKQAGYALTEAGTVHLFTLGLKDKLMDAILHRDTQPNTFDEWVTAARTELQKYTRRQAFKNPNFAKYQWTQPRHQERYRHPNDRTVPMDVDPPVFTQVRRAYTEADKDRFKKEGRCFYCDKQGHMAKHCPNKKSQNHQSEPQYRPKPQWQQSGQNQGYKKKPTKPHSQRTHGFRKHNQQYRRAPQIRSARIEEIDEIEEYEDDNDVASLAARTAKLSDGQHEQWVQDMKAMGINF